MASRTPTKRSTPGPADLSPVFAALKRVLSPYARRMAVKHDAPGIYYLESTAANRYGEEVFFGAVRTGKRSVAYHLMPIYVFPALTKTLSPELKKRLRGKACFQFTKVERPLLAELGALTKRGFEEFKRGGVFGK
jgi:hypothetical protein